VPLLKRLLRTNPAVLIQLLGAALALVVAFGLKLSTTQTGAILTFATVLASLFVRATVTSPATAARLKREQRDAEQRAHISRAAALEADEKRRNLATEHEATRGQLLNVRAQLANTQDRLTAAEEAARARTRPAKKATTPAKATKATAKATTAKATTARKRAPKK
jgi:hypothetical protein